MSGGIENAIVRHQMVRDAIASVSLSHPADCGCATCRAAQGDEVAFLEVFAEIADRLDRPPGAPRT